MILSAFPWPSEASLPRRHMTEILAVEAIQKRRGEEIFAPVSFTLQAGQGLGVIGYNGSGKTTLLDIIAGIETPTAGRVRLGGGGSGKGGSDGSGEGGDKASGEADRRAGRKAGCRLGYVMQHCGFQESLSFKDNLLAEAYLSGLRGDAAKAQAEWLAARLEILPYWKKRYSRGSSGMRGRLSVAAALIGQPPLLLLDEAFNFLDGHSVEQTRHVLLAEKERGAAIVMVSHNAADFDGLCERLLVLPQAQITELVPGGRAVPTPAEAAAAQLAAPFTSTQLITP